MTRVAAAILRDAEGKVLICRRSGGRCDGLWEFPGGKQEPDEDLADCIVRECREELELTIAPGSVFGVVTETHNGQQWEFTFLEAELVAGTPVLHVHSEVRWADAGELAQYEFCPADVPIAEALRGL